MSIKLNASSGSYNVQESEMLKDYKPPSKLSRCRVHFLDNSEGNFEIDRNAKGEVLLQRVFEHLELIEKDYFGLQFLDTSPESEGMRWLDSLKLIKKQIRGNPPYILFLRVKFYVSDPSKLKEEYTRYHFFLQIRNDMAEGRFHLPHKSAVQLASYAVQSELGDFNPEEHISGYLSEFRFIPGQTEDFENEVSELHRQHRKQTPADAEYSFLEHAKRQDMYGVELYAAHFKDKGGKEIQLGVMSAGLAVFQNSVRINIYTWSQVVKVSFKRKLFSIELRKERSESGDNPVHFNMETYRSCKNLWKSCVEHHTFFRLHSPPLPKNNLFTLQSKFRYSGRTEHETLEEVGKRARIARTFTRSSSKRYARRTMGPNERFTFSDNRRRSIEGRGESFNSRSTTTADSYGVVTDGLNRVSLHSSSVNRLPTVSNSRPSASNSASVHGSPPPSVESMVHLNHVRTTLPMDRTNHYGSLRHRGSARTTPTSDMARAEYRLSHPVELTLEQRHSRNFESKNNNWGSKTKVNGALDRFLESDFAIGHERLSHDSKDGFLSPVGARTQMYKCGDFIPTDEFPSELAPIRELVNGNTGNLVTIRMKPDVQGRFGFNVKGGADQGLPIIISRVAPNTPADLCIPRLNEGDQVLLINGRDISKHSHDQVIQFIRSAREMHSGELVLVVRPNVYIAEDIPDEPDFQYVPDNALSVHATPCHEGEALPRSLTLLQEGLNSGSVFTKFEQLYRRKPGMTMNAAMLTDNLSKNRYRDISPYDQTRVKVKDGVMNDYINANFVNMEIPVSGIVNRYIAAQGPLPNTAVDFWMMVWEQKSSLIVMLTTQSERGRVKCHQYWPDQCDAVKYGKLIVTGHKEELTSSFAYREFKLRHADKSGDERHIHQMQYMAWPDHGVPDDSSDFLSFVLRVRQNRIGMVEPTIVHCSAGIGRTGVLITMETAVCLIEANQPVYPLDIVRQMRDQRAMLIQTPRQFRFVCEAILKVYNDKIVRPLEDFR